MQYSQITGLPCLTCLLSVSIACSLENTESRCLPMHRFLIPDGYVGGIRVDFNVKDAPPLLVEGDHLVFTIPDSGYLRTPARYMCGWPQNFYYYSGNARRQLNAREMIRWNGFDSGYEPDFYSEIADYIFIGPKRNTLDIEIQLVMLKEYRDMAD